MKYYKISSQILFRNYGDFGYLTDNRNFGYNFADNDFVLGDEIVSEVGADILSCLEKRPLSINEIMSRVAKQFESDNNILNDTVEFLDLISSKGFVVKGTSPEECIAFDTACILEQNRSGNLKPNERANESIDTQAFLAKRFGSNPFPTSIHVEIVSVCNERCVHCYIPHELKTELMDESLFYSILNQSREMNLLHISISGGEPMLHPHFIDFVKKCREYDLSVNILSNLTLLDEKMIEEMKKNPLLSVQTSIYSMLPEIHDGITCHKGSLKKTVESVLKLIENHIPIQLSCSIMKANYFSYKGVQKWALEHNISAGTDYSIIAKYNHHKDNLSCRLSGEELKEIIADKMNNDPSYIENIEKDIADNKIKSPDDSVCSVCNSSICINPNGKVYPCVGWPDKVVGSLQDNNLRNIWLKSERVKSLRSIQRKDFVECESCNQKEYCTVCMVRNSNESPIANPFEVSKYFCNIAKIKKQLYEKKNSEAKLLL